LVAANRTLMQSVRDRAVALKAQGKSIDETATTIQTEMTAAHPAWPRANGIAAAAKAAYNEAR
jgi:ribosomal protein L12E/L44/L45/RPP1/RPP2